MLIDLRKGLWRRPSPRLQVAASSERDPRPAEPVAAAGPFLSKSDPYFRLERKCARAVTGSAELDGWRVEAGTLDRDRQVLRIRLVTPPGEGVRARPELKETWTASWIEEHVTPGDVFYDLGSKVGSYALIAWAVLGGKGTVVALESGDASYATLCDDVHLDGAQFAILPLPMAASDHAGEESLRYAAVSAGAASHELSAGDGGGTFPVVCLPLDETMATSGLPQPSHLTIDGAELAVFRGAGRTLAAPQLRSTLIGMHPDVRCEIEPKPAPEGEPPVLRPAYGLFTRPEAR